MKTPLQLLVIEDDLADFLLIERHLGRHGLPVACHRIASDPELDAALGADWDAVLSDYNVPGMDFLQVLAKIRARWPDLPILLISGSIGEEMAVDMLKLGIWDFILKDRLARLVPAIQRALHEAEERRALKAAGLALRESEKRFRLLFQLAPMPLALTNSEGAVVALNGRFVQLFGYTLADLPTLAEWWPRAYPDPAYRAWVTETWDAAVERAAKRGTDIEGNEYRVTCKDGSQRIMVVSGIRLKGDFLATFFDVTDRKLAELALAEREAQYQAVIETTSDGFWMLDEQGRLLVVNDAYARRSGYSREELLTMGIADLDAQESPEEVRAHIAKVRRDGSDLFETRHRAKDGEVWPAEISASYWASAGGRYFGFMRDITERKRTEAALRAFHAEMEQLTRVQVASQTVAALAHELNQPLNAVASYSEAALRLLRAGNPQPDKLRHALESSAQQAQRAGRVVRELLAFLKKGEVQTEPVDLNDAARSALARVEANALGAFQVRLELEPELARVSANRLQMERVLVNLIQNGIEAMHEGGVSPQAITVTVRTGSDAGMAQLTVRDSGPGVDGETLHRIFDPFFTTKPKGLGMGLAISRAIIESHGGQLWVESEPGAGASFHFTLPFAP